jgi:hypothetical protein
MALDVWFGLVQLAISSQWHSWVVGWLAGCVELPQRKWSLLCCQGY